MAFSALTLYALAGDIKDLYIISFIIGASHVIIFASSYGFVSVLIPAVKRAGLFGWFNAIQFLSWGLPATIITGPIVDLFIKSGKTKVFSYQMGLLSAAMLTLIGFFIHALLIFYLIPKKNKKKCDKTLL